MKSDWEELIAVCQERNVDPGIVIWPEKHRDGVSCTKRANILRELKNKGVRPVAMISLCPLTETRIYEILRNGK